MACGQNDLGALAATMLARMPSLAERMARSATPLRSLACGGDVV